MDALDRFNKYIKIVSSGCHEWQSTMHRDGYGKFWYEGGTRMAHRISYFLNVGEIPKGMLILHKCDNRKCVNPRHLYVGDYSDNAQDMHNRGRAVGHRTLTKESVAEIRNKYANGGITQSEIAEEYGVKQAAISKIILGQTWSK